MTRPNRLVEGLAHHLGEQEDFKFARVMGRDIGTYIVYRHGSRSHELLEGKVLAEVAEHLQVSKGLLLTALDSKTNTLPRRSIT